MKKVDLRLEEGINEPLKGTEGSSGFDVKAARFVTLNGYPTSDKLSDKEDILLLTGDRILVGTGIFVNHIDENLEIQVRSRSSLPEKKGIIVGNGVGTIDSDYRGEIFVSLFNISPVSTTVTKGERVAQLVICELPSVEVSFNKGEKTETQRGDGGFGSTGNM